MENAALRLQLAAFQRKRKRPALTSFDRLFWVGLSVIWNGWRPELAKVLPLPVNDRVGLYVNQGSAPLHVMATQTSNVQAEKVFILPPTLRRPALTMPFVISGQG